MRVPHGQGAHAEAYRALSDWLAQTRALWQPRPFVDLPAPWEAEFQDAAAWLRRCDDQAVEALERGEALQGMPEPLAEIFRATAGWGAVSPLADHLWDPIDAPSLARRVPKTKAGQVRALASVAVNVAGAAGASRVIDWCSGKGHLGRTVGAAAGLPLRLIEREASLCRVGEAMAAEASVPCDSVALDVMKDALSGQIRRGDLVVALHACGALSERLVEEAAVQRAAGLVLSPCCYHRGHGPGGRAPMSRIGTDGGLVLDHAALRLASLDERESDCARRPARLRGQAWRLAVDLLVREASGIDRYTPLGAIPERLFRGPFEVFARHVAERDGLPLPATWCPEGALAAGHARAKVARRLGVLRAQFRRPLERWLVLDRAVRLEEQGYQVSVGTFCQRTLTPRNLAVVAIAAA